MYNSSFYPTLPEVAEKMLAKASKLYERSILEPSAGKGDLADAAVEGWIAITTVSERECIASRANRSCGPRSGARAIRWLARTS